MTIGQQNRRHRRKVARQIQGGGGGLAAVATGIWSWIDGVAQGVGRFLTGPLHAFTHATRLAFSEVVDLFADYYEALWRALTWFDRKLLAALKTLLLNRIKAVAGRERADFRYLLGLIYLTTQTVLTEALRAVRTERNARRTAITRAEALARQDARLALQTVQREAASAYRTGYQARLSIIQRLLETAVTRDPLLKDAVKLLTRGLLDFASVDDPLARLALGFLLRDVIDRLGVDKAIGGLAADLIGPLIGDPRPRDLHAVIRDISDRLGRIEGQWAGFMAAGGPQVEQAGRDWRDVTSLAGDAVILGLVTEAVAQPRAWAAAISATLGEAGNAAVIAVSDLTRRG